MKFRISAMACLVALCILALATAGVSQEAQPSGTGKTSSAAAHKSAGGSRTVVGCVAHEGEGFVLKTDEGTYEFDTSRDLTPWLGKKVKLTGTWSATGVTTTAPIKSSTAASTQMTEGEKKAGTAQSFVGDLRLHITGSVIGDCAETK